MLVDKRRIKNRADVWSVRVTQRRAKVDKGTTLPIRPQTRARAGLLSGLNFEVIPSTYEEDLNPSDFSSHGEYAVETALNKVKELELRLSNDPVKPEIIVAADTVVSLNGKTYGKPKNKEEAARYLEILGGKQHTVFTGVVIKTPSVVRKFFESTKVYVAQMDKKTIDAYVATNEPMDKAGAYGIQGFGGSLIEKIDGDYFNVMGLPLHSFCKHLLDIYK